MSDILLSFTVPGEPVAKGRPKIGINPGTGRAQAFTPSKTRKAENDVKLFASNAMGGREPLMGALILEIVAYRSKGLPKTGANGDGKLRRGMLDGSLPPTTKPDVSNIAKMAEDACNGIVYGDDAQIVSMTVTKLYSSRPRIKITLRRWEPSDAQRYQSEIL